MGLEVYQQCVLIIFLLGMRGTRLNEIMECGIGEVVSREDAKVECYDTKEMEERPPVLRNCKLVQCRQNQQITWKVTDEKSGKIEVQLYGKSEGCDFDYYDIYLEVYEDKEVVNEGHRCLAGSWLWKTHSKRISNNLNCSSCSKDPSDCIQIHTLIFKYVYPGIYRIKITPKLVDGSTRQSQVSDYFRIEDSVSKYVKNRLVDLNFSISLQYRDSARLLDVGIPLAMDFPPEIVGFEIKYSPHFVDLYAIKRYGSNEEKEISCSLNKNLSKPICHATNQLIQCSFYNMSEGDYQIIVEFIDDRCEMNTLWTESPTSNYFDDLEACLWEIKTGYKPQPLPDGTLVESSHAEILYSSVALSILLFVLVIAFVLRKRRRTTVRRLFEQPDSGGPGTALYTINSSPSSNRFNFGQLLTLTERPRTEVLLLYARESPAFMELVARLKSVLDKICKCQVYDCFDMELWNEISKDPEGWIRVLMVERQAKVIVVASEVAVIRQRSLMSEEPEMSYKSPHPFDHLFLYALKILRDGIDEDSYKNHFVVTFDGLTETEALMEYFNPYTRFILPKHLNKLIEHLHDSDGGVHIETSSRLEEKFEVRQLRLQIEHLINMKLLSQSDVEKEELYDW